MEKYVRNVQSNQVLITVSGLDNLCLRYNIFIDMNIKDESTIHQISQLLKEISLPARIRILLTIGREEVCVCHLEAVLGMRQAYLSQHLMALRQAGVLITNRNGRFINYRLANPKILDVIKITANLLNISLEDGRENNFMKKLCSCPKCRRFDEVVFPIP